MRRKRRGEQERSASGQPILRHLPRETPFELAAHVDSRARDAIDAHYEGHLGPCDSVWHEIVSDLVHIDVYMWRPSENRGFYTFCTVGMSDMPMTVPPNALEAGRSALAELLICLPASWPVPAEANAIAPWDDPDAYFPIRWLKQLARLPHEYKTWLGFGHTIPNGDPPVRFAGNTELCGWVLLPPMTLPKSFWHLELPDERTVDFFGITALHQDELDCKLANGVESLFEGFDRHGVNELLDPTRPSSIRA
jgi:hypothetical protein